MRRTPIIFSVFLLILSFTITTGANAQFKKFIDSTKRAAQKELEEKATDAVTDAAT